MLPTRVPEGVALIRSRVTRPCEAWYHVAAQIWPPTVVALTASTPRAQGLPDLARLLLTHQVAERREAVDARVDARVLAAQCGAAVGRAAPSWM